MIAKLTFTAQRKPSAVTETHQELFDVPKSLEGATDTALANVIVFTLQDQYTNIDNVTIEVEDWCTTRS